VTTETPSTALATDPADGAVDRAGPSLGNFWHPVAASEDVVAEPLGVRLLERDLVLFRDRAGAVHAWHDICVHRGTKLSLGRVENDRLICPYHGWEYACDSGRCVRIPALPEDASIPTRARAETYRAKDVDGFVWVALGDPVVDVETIVPDDGREWRSLLVAQGTTWAASAGRAAENSFDMTHTPFVHPGLLFDDYLPPPIELTERQYGFRVDYPGAMNIGSEKLFVQKHLTVQLPFMNDIWAVHDESGSGYATRIAASPVSPKECRMFVVNIRNYELEPEKDESFRSFSETVLLQDQAMVESQRPEELPLRLREELHLKVPDRLAVLYRRKLALLDDVDLARYKLRD
jgi:phenylpropionate dioxygenase-like ring-hydroxylating dioxygenase large terminal subunit